VTLHKITLRSMLSLSVLVAAILTASAVCAAERHAAAEARLSSAVQLLAADELEGRGVGLAGLDRAADYIAAQFREIGLKIDLYNGTPFQKFELNVGARLGEVNHLALVGPAGQRVNLDLRDQFIPLPLGGSGEFDLPLVFAGYGITAKDEGYDDYADLDVRGKAVIVLRHEPQQDDPDSAFEGKKTSQFAPLSRKISNAYEHGAAAVLFCSTEHGVLKQLASDRRKQKEGEAPSEAEQLARADALLKFDRVSGEEDGRDFPVLHLQRAPIDAALEAALKTNLATLEKQIDHDFKPRTQELAGWRAQGQVTVVREKATVKNVLGVLEGEGPLANETIVVGAHYDHLGRGGAGSLAPGSDDIHNGADDNASGAAALIEVARRLAEREGKLPRRVLFIAFTGEERGLLGSAYYVKHPLFPLADTIAMLNMDMVGRLRDDKLIVYGTGTSDALVKLLDATNAQFQFKLSKQPAGFGPSDQTSFYAKQIPVLHYFTGIHSDYHRPSDDTEKLNIEGMSRIADMVVETTVLLAEAKERPDYKSTGAGHGQLGGGGGDGDRPYFGSIPEFGVADPGYAISGVTKGSPAEKGGLLAGDIIIQVGDSKIGSLEDFDSALRKHKGGEKVPVVVRRAGKEVTLEVTLGEPR